MVIRRNLNLISVQSWTYLKYIPTPTEGFLGFSKTSSVIVSKVAGEG